MSNKVADRILWTVEILNVQPDDHLLEIGCGHGVAVSLICEKLSSGHITAIDRSQAMIDAASNRNRACIDSGKARFQAAALDKADFGDARFHKIFAVNVSLFWTPPAREWDILRGLLLPDGAVYMVHQPPAADKVQESVDQLQVIVPGYGYQIEAVEYKDLKPVQAVCVTARLI